MNYFYDEDVTPSYWLAFKGYRLPSIRGLLLATNNMHQPGGFTASEWLINAVDMLLAISFLYGLFRLAIYGLDLVASCLALVPNMFTKNVAMAIFSMLLGYLAYVFSLTMFEAENNLAIVFDSFQDYYREFLIRFTDYCFGLDLASRTETEVLAWGSLLFIMVSGVVFYYCSYIYKNHRVFSLFLVFVSIYLYFQTFQVTPQSIKFYTNNKSFVIDKDQTVASIAPNAIPKIIVILVVIFQLVHNLLRFLRFLLRASFRLIILLVLVILAFNSLFSLGLARERRAEEPSLIIDEIIEPTEHVPQQFLI